MPPPTAIELLGTSVRLVLTHFKVSDAEFAEKVSKTRQWVYKLTRGQSKDTGLENVDVIASVLSDLLGSVLLPSDLFQPLLIETKLRGLTSRVTPPVVNSGSPETTRGHGDASTHLSDSLGRLERSDARLTSIFFDVYTVLARHFESGDSGDLRRAAPSVKKAARSGERRRKSRA